MKTIGMKKTLCLAAALAALCIAACKTGKTEESTAKNTGDGAYEEISAYHESDTGETEEPKARNMWGGIYGKIPAYYKDGLEPDAVNEKIKTRRAEDLGKLNGKYDSLKNDYLKKTLGRDLSRLSMNDLLTLHSGVYAVNGLLFKDNNLYSRFISKKGPIPWYADYMCYLLELEYWKKSKKIAASEKDVTLSAAEKEFVDKVDGRIAELRKNGMYVSKNGYTVGDIAHVVNMDMLKTWDKSYMDKLAQNNFVIAEMETGHLQLFHLYEQNDYRAMPSFVTTDLFLQAFHIYLSYALKVLEDKNFIPALEDLTFGLYKASMELSKSGDAEIAQIAEWNTVFYAVPYTLLTGEELKISAKYLDYYAKEVTMSKEAKADGVLSEFLSAGNTHDSDNDVVMHYSLFKPRGHYTRKPKTEAYFRAMMWLQKAYACRIDAPQLKQNIFTANLLNTAKSPKGRPLVDVYASIFEPTALLVGEPNNLSVMDIAKILKDEGIKELSTALSDENVKKIDRMLIAISDCIIIKPKSQLSCNDKINFMPQRYLIDNEVLMEMVDTSRNAPRAFPKGLDVFSAFGSAPAADVLNNFYNEKEKWAKYPSEMEKLQKKFSNFDGWNKSVYNKWIESLLALQKSDKSYPAFMNTTAWDYKNLNTSLASWAELKHDFILYADQPVAMEAGGCGDPQYLPRPDIEAGYVEPNLLFWNKLDELAKLINGTLAKHNLLNPDLKGKSGELRKFIDFLTGATQKELAKKPLSAEEYKTIKGIGGAVENFTITVLDPDLDVTGLLSSEWEMKDGIYHWNKVKGPDRSIAVAADVYTRNMPGDPKNGILHAATGKANEIYVIVEINGYLYLTRGAAFSYYEFVMPPGTRLTDAEWQKIEDNKSKRPAVQEWMKDIAVDKKPAPNVIGGWNSDNGPECFDYGCF